MEDFKSSLIPAGAGYNLPAERVLTLLVMTTAAAVQKKSTRQPGAPPPTARTRTPPAKKKRARARRKPQRLRAGGMRGGARVRSFRALRSLQRLQTPLVEEIPATALWRARPRYRHVDQKSVYGNHLLCRNVK